MPKISYAVSLFESLFRKRSSWVDIPGVEIEILSRGEDIVYREGGREYHFCISCDQHPLVLFASKYWDGTYPITQKVLNTEERSRLIPRLVAYLSCKGESVEVRDE